MSHHPSFLNRRRLIQGMAAFAAAGLLADQPVAANWARRRPRTRVASFGADADNLRSRAANRGLLYGAATRHNSLTTDPGFAQIFAQECGVLVPEWELKWNFLRPSPTEFNFYWGDWMANFAQTHGQLFRGHALIWHDALPAWFNETVNAQNAAQIFTQHVDTVVRHFARRVHSWDVVNEAISPADGEAYGLRRTPWLQFLGPGYVEQAFRFAAQADPNALLVYNEDGLDYDRPQDDAKRQAVLNFLVYLRNRGVPVHVLGIQAHLDGNETRFNASKLRQFLADVASLGIRIMITELDVIDADLPADVEVRDRIIAETYRNYLDVVLDEGAVMAVLNWSLTDRYTWLAESSFFNQREDGLATRPAPLDADLNRKLAWNAIARSFDRAPQR
jgi:endo-1,4-beta-xylanase